MLGQQEKPSLKGHISFITSNNIYVKFKNTQQIKAGDTIEVAGKPCLLVKNKSTSSVVCTSIFNCTLTKGAEVSYRNSRSNTKKKVLKKEKPKVAAVSTKVKKKKINPEDRSELRGRLSVSSYSTLSDKREDRHRVAARFSLDAERIQNSKFSFETYINYWKNIDKVRTSEAFLRVYDLSVKYEADPTLSFVVGRKINPKASSLGAIDGLQVEKNFNNNYIGLIGGFRPDFYDFGFNSKLVEYGAYYGRKTKAKNFYSETTIGVLEQQNNGNVDRRYAYFQHSSTIFKKLYLFSSVELDGYSKVKETISNRFRLTNLYASVRYRFNKQINATVSYDSRKRILYYETFQTEIERILDDDVSRQGIRARINLRPTDIVNVGLSYSKRFQSDRDNKSDNFYLYLGLTKVPGIGGRVSVNYNINSSNYLESNILSARYSRDFFKHKLYTDFYYRLVNYDYIKSNPNLNNKIITQSYYGANLSYDILRGLTFSVSGEYSNSSTGLDNNYRIYTKLTKRFRKKRIKNRNR